MKHLHLVYILFALGFSTSVYSGEKPIVYLIGDSTVKCGQGLGEAGLWGWGDHISDFFNPRKTSVINMALGGTSSRTFQTKGNWRKVLSLIKKGDYLLIQFGHNDSSPVNDDSRARGTLKGTGNEQIIIDNLLTKQTETVFTYGKYLEVMISETIAKGAFPIIITPIPRNIWENNKIIQSAESYPDWAIEVANRKNIPYIDLHNLMIEKLNKLSELKVTGKYFFAHDHTHTTIDGAKLAASLVAGEIENLTNSNLKKLLIKEK